MNTLVKIEWTVLCKHCGHKHVELQEYMDDGCEYGPPAVPHRCDECDGRLRNTPFAWDQTFRVLVTREV